MWDGGGRWAGVEHASFADYLTTMTPPSCMLPTTATPSSPSLPTRPSLHAHISHINDLVLSTRREADNLQRVGRVDGRGGGGGGCMPRRRKSSVSWILSACTEVETQRDQRCLTPPPPSPPHPLPSCNGQLDDEPQMSPSAHPVSHPRHKR
jgi:hypothetical protein